MCYNRKSYEVQDSWMARFTEELLQGSGGFLIQLHTSKVLPRMNYSPCVLISVCLQMSLFLEDSTLRCISPQGYLRGVPTLWSRGCSLLQSLVSSEFLFGITIGLHGHCLLVINYQGFRSFSKYFKNQVVHSSSSP